jgi:TolC family type I secretion outer membrane protein
MAERLGHSARRWMLRRRAAVAALLMLLAAPAAAAQTLDQALSEAYETNPDLKVARAQLNATNEQRPIALGNWLPTVTLGAAANRTVNSVPPSAFISGSRVNDLQALATVSQPITSGGREFAQLALAEDQIRQQRAALLASEETLLDQAASAYMNVLTARATLDYSLGYQDALRRATVAMASLTQVGDRTLGELAFTRERLADAEARVASSRGALDQARAVYRQVIGDIPGALETPAPLPMLPPTLNDAIALALRANASVVQGEYALHAALDQVRIQEAALLPSLSLVGQLQRDWRSFQQQQQFLAPGGAYDTPFIELRLTMPLYPSGAAYAQIRAAEKTAEQVGFQLDSARKAAISATVGAWQQRDAAQATLSAYSRQVAQAKITVAQFQRQFAAGLATVLELLDGYQDLLSAETNFVTARQERILADFAVLQNIGGLTARTLALPVSYYDPEGDYQQIKWKIFGLGVQPVR